VCYFGSVAHIHRDGSLRGNEESGKAKVWRERANLRPRGGEVSTDRVLVTRYRCGECVEGKPGR